MTSEQILIALGGVDDTLLELCETYRAPRRSTWKVLAAAACFALALLAGMAALHRARIPISPEPTAPQTAQSGETHAAVYPETAAQSGTEDSQTPPFGFETTRQTAAPTNGTGDVQRNSGAGFYGGQDGRSAQEAAGTDEAFRYETDALFQKAPITTKYPSMTWQGKTYTSRGNSDPSDKVQETILGTSELNGFDGVHKTTVKVLPIGGVSQAAAVAVQFADDARYYTYVCASFAPATLGEYLDAFSLWDNAAFTRVSGCSRKYAATLYPAPSAQTLRSLFDRSAKRTTDVLEDDCPQDMTLDCTAPLFGVKGSAFGVSETGYLLCRLTDSTVVYFIGAERAQAFLDAMDAGEATHLVATTAAPRTE